MPVTVLPRRWLYRHAYRRLGKEVTGIICHSRYFAEILSAIGMPNSKIYVIPYGIDVHEFRPGKKKDPNLILAVGRFVEKKAPNLTIQAFAKVLNTVPYARLEMIGNGPLLSRCRSAAHDLKISDKVVFHGAKETDFVKEKMKGASVFVQHSVTASNGDTESFGISILEAMASEIPVVVTRHNGFVETVLDGETGFLIEEYDVDSMAERVAMLLKDPELRIKMGKASRIRAKKYYSPEIQLGLLRKLLLK